MAKPQSVRYYRAVGATSVVSKKLGPFIKKHWIFLSFFAYSAFSWSWILKIDISSLASPGASGKMMRIVGLLVVVLMSAVIYTRSLKWLFASLKKSRSWTVPLKLVVWWAATELFVAWAVSIVWYGTGARFDNVLPFTSLSHFAIWTPLGYLSRFVGLYGLSGVVFMLLSIAIIPYLRRYLVPVVSIVAIATFYAWGLYKMPSGPKINAVVVSERSSEDKLLEPIEPSEGSLVVFPEYAFSWLDNESISSKIRPLYPVQTAYFVGSRYVREQGTLKNQLVAGDTSKGYVYKIYKSRLIPGGEYLPYATVALFKLIGAGDEIDNFRATREITKAEGTPKQMLLDFGDIKIGAGVCSGIIAPEDYRQMARGGANIFTNSAYLGRFRGAKVYSWQHQSMAKFMATANARTFLQSATSGPSFGFDGNGKRLFYKDTTGTTELSVSLNRKRTLYSFLGEYLAALGLVWMLLDFVRSRKKSK